MKLKQGQTIWVPVADDKNDLHPHKIFIKDNKTRDYWQPYITNPACKSRRKVNFRTSRFNAMRLNGAI